MPLDDDEFDAIFAATYRPLLRYARRRLESRALAETVVSETFLLAWTAKSRKQEITLPWLYRVAQGKIQEHDRRPDRQLPISSGVSEPGADQSGSVLDRKVLVDALVSLPWKEREAILLTYWEELSLAELAVALGCRERKAGAVLERAKARLIRFVGSGVAASSVVEGVRDVVPEH